MAVSHQRGYNHNIAHRGRVYHVQSEDSGSTKSHIYTHVFVNGTIIATNKVDYTPEAAAQDLAAHVVSLMQASHKKMIKQLRNGELDQKIEVLLGGHPEPANKAAPNKVTRKITQPQPVLAQQKISSTPPARRVTAPQPAATQAKATASSALLSPALRSTLSANEHAQQWLANHGADLPQAETQDSNDVKARLAQLRHLLSQQVLDPDAVPVEEEITRLFREF